MNCVTRLFFFSQSVLIIQCVYLIGNMKYFSRMDLDRKCLFYENEGRIKQLYIIFKYFNICNKTYIIY